MRWFNTAGPIKPDKHYCIPPLSRVDLDEVLRLVEEEKYFMLHAPRQTGKTSALLALAELLTERDYGCVYVTVETARTARDDVHRAMHVVLATLANAANAALGDRFLDEAWPGMLAKFGPDMALSVALERWAEASPRPLVLLLIDEIDTLVGDSLLSVLQQLRAGYPGRPERFPHSVVLCGMRDLRDYRMGATGSPFNIAAASLRLDDFSREETLALLSQHTEETGQAFAPEALEAVWTQTRGQPWLVNALAHGACFKNRALREDRSRTVTADDVAAVREDLIVNRVTHLDYLADKLRENRVRQVIEPMLSGGERHAVARDLEYARDLGLVAQHAPVRIANPIYAEVIPRELAWVAQEELAHDAAPFAKADGSLDAERLMADYQTFFRRHSEHWRNRFAYQEAWPQLLLQAYLQRVVNGGGRIEREYAIGRGRVDLLIVWPLANRVQEFVVECKVVRDRDGLESVVNDGVEQTAAYVDRCAAEAGHLIVIDRRENRSWEEKIFHHRRRPARSRPGRRGVSVDAWGM